jgi:hypothetical protein
MKRWEYKDSEVGPCRRILDAGRLKQELVFAFYIQRDILLHRLQKYYSSAPIHKQSKYPEPRFPDPARSVHCSVAHNNYAPHQPPRQHTKHTKANIPPWRSRLDFVRDSRIMWISHLQVPGDLCGKRP